MRSARVVGTGLLALVPAIGALLAPAVAAAEDAPAPGAAIDTRAPRLPETTGPQPAGSDTGASADLPVVPAPLTKKARHLAAKRQDAPMSPAERARWHAQLRARRGKPAPAVLNIFNTWTHEYLTVADPGEVSQERMDRFFRCHFTGQPTDMDPRLFAALVAAARHFHARDIHIVSGFRAPKYNLMLRKKGREVARTSQHTLGSAVDFRVLGVPVARLHAWARRQRLGGVGFYPSSGFIHMDTGPVRYWQGR